MCNIVDWYSNGGKIKGKFSFNFCIVWRWRQRANVLEILHRHHNCESSNLLSFLLSEYTFQFVWYIETIFIELTLSVAINVQGHANQRYIK